MGLKSTAVCVLDGDGRLVKKVGFNKAKVAVAHKLAIILFGMWRDGTHSQFKAETVDPHRQMMQAARA